jgi:hypothetical protein
MKYLITLFLIPYSFNLFSCDCPFSKLNLEECNKYEIIYRGKILSVNQNLNKPSEAIFEVLELYKGNSSKQFKLLFETKTDCAQQLIVGQEWIIYSNYKQIDNAKLDWCSRSRKLFANAKEDFYTISNGNDYDDELKFLRTNLGLHRLLQLETIVSTSRNQLPTSLQSIIIVLSSIVVLVLFYFLLGKRFSKK